LPPSQVRVEEALVPSSALLLAVATVGAASAVSVAAAVAAAMPLSQLLNHPVAAGETS
jgi:hypothetical protein